MVQNRGLEIRTEGATPIQGEMTLYLKAGPDPSLPGDCPFAQTTRMVLSEKNLPYTLRPTTPETKPSWLLDFYGGALPALRHRKECYVESDVVCQYLEFFFEGEEGGLSSYSKRAMRNSGDLIEGFFGSVAKYLKYAGDVGDGNDLILRGDVEDQLKQLEVYLDGDVDGGDEGSRAGPYLVGDGERFTLVDCQLGPKLYHLMIGLKAFKEDAIDLEDSFPLVHGYYKAVLERPSFQETIVDEETVVWGWTNARIKN